MFSRIARTWAIVCLIAALPAFSADKAHTVSVTILYSNDFHAAIAPMKATWLVDQPDIGGAANFAGWVDAMRRLEPNAFLFDSGDLYTGQAISFLTRGQALIDFFKTVGYDAVCYGNHEFDYGIPGALKYSEQEPFPVLSANLFYKKDGRPFAKPYAIIERNGIRIAVIGIFGVDAKPSTGPAIWDTLDVKDPAQVLNELVPKLRQQADLVVVLAHQGETGPMQADAEAHPEVQRDFDADKKLVEAVPGIDVFVGGHAHRGIEVPWVGPKNGTIVVQTYGRGTTLGVLRLTLDRARHKVVAHGGGLVRVTPGVFSPTPQQMAVIRVWDDKADKMAAQIVGTATAPLHRNYDGESPLGDLITDAMLWKAGAQVAFENAGGIRGDLEAGPLTRGELIGAAPFINSLVTMQMTGAQVRDVLEQSLTLKVGMMQAAGVRIKYDLSRPEYHRLLSVEVGGAPLDDVKTYRVVTNSFVARGGDHYEIFTQASNAKDSGELVSDLLFEYVKAKGTVEAPNGARMTPVE